MIDDIADEEPLAPFRRWFDAAQRAEPLAEAMMLATATAAGAPSVRAVLLKEFGASGFVFYTNIESRKSEELAANPQAALCFHWKSLQRQVRIEGRVGPVSAAEADSYFATRPRDSQLAAWASDQSRPLENRPTLEARVDSVTRRFADSPTVARPPFWSGFRLTPTQIEFWQERAFRLHDRLLFVRDGERWRRQRLFP